MGEFQGRTTSAAQDEIIDYVDTVLRGEKARGFGSSMMLTDLSGSRHERSMFGGIFVAAVLHYAEHRPAPTTDRTANKELWRKGFEIYHRLDGFRDNGRIPPAFETKLREYGTGV